MVSLEQVKLLDAKVSKAIEYIGNLSQENAALRGKLDGYRRRIDELEVLVKAFKDDQGRIEESINAALDRLSQFEAVIESGADEPAAPAEAAVPAISPEAPEPDTVGDPVATTPVVPAAAEDSFEAAFAAELAAEAAAQANAADPIETEATALPSPDRGAELDIF